MPMWHIYCPESLYSREDKKKFAERITKFYEKFVNLPRFYVSVIFQELPPHSFFMGGEETSDFVRIWIDHVARTTAEDGQDALMRAVNKTIDPFVHERGLRSEIHIDDTPIGLWSIQGLKPPDANSDVEKKWIAENKPSKY